MKAVICVLGFAFPCAQPTYKLLVFTLFLCGPTIYFSVFMKIVCYDFFFAPFVASEKFGCILILGLGEIQTFYLL